MKVGAVDLGQLGLGLLLVLVLLAVAAAIGMCLGDLLAKTAKINDEIRQADRELDEMRRRRKQGRTTAGIEGWRHGPE